MVNGLALANCFSSLPTRRFITHLPVQTHIHTLMVEATVQGAILLIYPKIPSVLTHHQEHFGASWPRHSHRVLIYVTLCGASPHALPRFITLGENTNSVPVLRRVKVFKGNTDDFNLTSKQLAAGL